MRELKIDLEMRDFIPPLSGEEKKQLEDSLLKYGYKGTPIYIWNDYIVDGHNRYELCKKHNIEYPIEELLLGDNATLIDVMEWMINTQLGRRNLPPAQRLAVMDKFKKKIQEQARERQSEAGKEFGNGKNSSSPNGEKQKNIHTDKELAKMAGVGTGTVAYDTKEEVMRWMLDIQLGRRNLSPIQRIAVAEKYRPIYERQATINKSLNGGDKKSELVKLPTPIDKIDVREKLASVAGVSGKTYSMGKKILNSDNETLKQEVLSEEKSINAGYKELTQNKKEEKADTNKEINNVPQSLTTIKPTTSKPQISEEVKQICADLKTEKTKEYLDSIWDYKIAIIECMNADFEMYYDGFVSTLNDMETRVTQSESDECIANAESNIEKLLVAIELAKETKLKMED